MDWLAGYRIATNESVPTARAVMQPFPWCTWQQRSCAGVVNGCIKTPAVIVAAPVIPLYRIRLSLLTRIGLLTDKRRSHTAQR